MTENMPLHEWIAQDAYWGAPEAFTVVPPANKLQEAEAATVATVAGSGSIVREFRKMQGVGGFEGTCLALPAGEPLPVLGTRDPGVLQLIYDQRTTYPDSTSRAARVACGLTVDADTFNMAATAMEWPGTLQLQMGVAITPNVVVARSVRYARGVRLPFGGLKRYAELRHVSVPNGDLISRTDTMNIRSVSRPVVDGDLVSGTTVEVTSRKGAVTLSRIVAAYHLKPGHEPPGGEPWWSFARLRPHSGTAPKTA